VFLHKSGLVVLERSAHSRSFFACPQRDNLVEPLRDQPRKPRRPPMGEEKKYEGAGDPIKMLLEEALEKQRNAMMDNFAQILQLPTGGASTSRSHSGGATPFKVQVNFAFPYLMAK
jgi:hypothetical protein